MMELVAKLLQSHWSLFVSEQRDNEMKNVHDVNHLIVFFRKGGI